MSSLWCPRGVTTSPSGIQWTSQWSGLLIIFDYTPHAIFITIKNGAISPFMDIIWCVKSNNIKTVDHGCTEQIGFLWSSEELERDLRIKFIGTVKSS